MMDENKVARKRESDEEAGREGGKMENFVWVGKSAAFMTSSAAFLNDTNNK